MFGDIGMIPILAASLAFLSVMVLVFGLAGARDAMGKAERLRGRMESGTGYIPSEAKQDAGFIPRAGLADLLARIGQRLWARSSRQDFGGRLKYLQAGLFHSNAPSIFHGVRVSLVVLLPASLFLLHLLVPAILPVRFLLISCMLAAYLGHFLPGYWLDKRILARRKTFLAELPDALDLLVVCVEAGMGLDQAMTRVSQEMARTTQVVSEELRIVNLELRAGKNRQDALKNLALRSGLTDVESLVTLLIQSDLFGTSVAQTLRVYSDTLRTRRYQRAEEKAAKLPVKLLLPLIIFIFPALLAAVMGPAAIKLINLFSQLNN